MWFPMGPAARYTAPMDGFVARRDLISPESLKALSRRAGGPAIARLAAHLGSIALTCVAIGGAAGTGWVLPAMAAHGIVVIFLFAPLHEAIHRTAFRRRWSNDALAWIAGLVLVLPPGYFRRFHFAHHRHTQDPARDPELAGPKPATPGAYLLYVSGWGYWREAVLVLGRHALGRVAEPYIPAGERPAVVSEARAFVACYAAMAVAALAVGTWAPVYYWLVPVVLGQPALRLFLLAEHTGCPITPDMMANTRTTVSNAAVRFLAWNMPYHAEHHAFPGVPFHALPALHRLLAGRHGVVATGYTAAHRGIVAALLVRPTRRTATP